MSDDGTIATGPARIAKAVAFVGALLSTWVLLELFDWDRRVLLLAIAAVVAGELFARAFLDD